MLYYFLKSDGDFMTLSIGSFIEEHRSSLLWIAIVLIVVIFLGITLFNILIKRYRFKKQVRDFEKKYNYEHALLIGQDSSYLKRIYSISNYNLLYQETYATLLKQYEELVQTRNEQAENALNMLKDSLDHTKGKSNKENIKRNKEVLDNYFQDIEAFSKDLKDILSAEEDAQEKSLSQKEKVRQIKQTYYEHKDEIKIVEESFNVLFDNIDEAFKRYDAAIDCANYEEVQAILSRIDNVLKELEPVLAHLPHLCTKLSEVLPNKIVLLREKAEEMIKNGYQLNHLHVNSNIEEYEARMTNVKRHLEALDIQGCDEEMDRIIVAIDELSHKIELEKDTKEHYENSKDVVSKNVKVLEDKFIKIYNLIPNISKHYVIEDKYFNEIEVIRFNISKIGNVKRTLDSYVHSLTPQPFSILDNKCNELDELTKVATRKLNEFSSYLLSLEEDYNTAIDAIKEGYLKLKEIKSLVHELNLPNYENSLENRFDKLFLEIEEINKLLKIQPIDIRQINNLVLHFETEKDNLVTTVEKDNNFATITENLVVYANKYRPHSSEIANLFAQIETSFFDGEFERAYMDAGSATKKIKNTTESSAN